MKKNILFFPCAMFLVLFGAAENTLQIQIASGVLTPEVMQTAWESVRQRARITDIVEFNCKETETLEDIRTLTAIKTPDAHEMKKRFVFGNALRTINPLAFAQLQNTTLCFKNSNVDPTILRAISRNIQPSFITRLRGHEGLHSLGNKYLAIRSEFLYLPAILILGYFKMEEKACRERFSESPFVDGKCYIGNLPDYLMLCMLAILATRMLTINYLERGYQKYYPNNVQTN